MLFDGCYFHMAILYTGQDLVKAVWMGWCSDPDANFLLSRKMTGWDENIPLPYSTTTGNINIFH